MKLYFLRHGIAVEASEWEGSDDDRPLTEEGLALMAREAEGIAALDLGARLVLTSPLKRAQQTAQALTKALGLKKGPQAEERLGPGFGRPLLKAILADYRKEEALILVGHEPDLSLTVGQLSGGANIDIKKGALAAVELDDPEGMRGRLLWLMQAKGILRLLEARR